MLTFTDEFTQYSWIYLTENCKTLESCFVGWKNSVESQSGEKLVVICTDQGGEYKGLEKKLERQGIKIEFTAAYTPEQNGISERLNRTLVETASALLVNAKLPHTFWGEAISHANWLRNHLPLSDINTIGSKTPHEAWFNSEKPNLRHTKVFGSLVLVYMSTKMGRAKLDEKVFDSIFIGYQSGVTNHQVWNPTKGNVMWSLFVEVFETRRGSELLSIPAPKDKWEYQLNLDVNDNDDSEVELPVSVGALPNTNTSSPFNSLVKRSNLTVADKGGSDQEKHSEWDTTNNSEAKNSEEDSSRPEPRDKARQDHNSGPETTLEQDPSPPLDHQEPESENSTLTPINVDASPRKRG